MPAQERQRAFSFFRRAITGPADLVFPDTVIHMGNGLPEAEALLTRKIGVAILISHPDKRSPLESAKEIVFKSKIMRNCRVTTPIAYHQYIPSLNALLSAIGVQQRPVVTAETIARGLNDSLPLGWGSEAYLKDGIATLREGGVMIIAPQGGRRDKLGEPEIPTTSVLVRTAQIQGLTNYAFMFVGFGLVGVTHYSQEQTGGYNLFKKYQTRIGNTYTIDEVLKKSNAIANGEEGNGLTSKEKKARLRNIDTWVFKQLTPLVPSAYR